VLQAAGRLKTEIQRGTRQIKDSITEKMKNGEGIRCMDNCLITWMKPGGYQTFILMATIWRHQVRNKVQKWPLYTRQLVQTILRIKF
jgi:hypothetical protein